MRTIKAIMLAGAIVALAPAAALSHTTVPAAPAAGSVVLADAPGLGTTAPGANAGTYVHRFGRLHDLRRLDNAPSPGAPQHRFGLPDSLQIPGRFVRPDRIGPFNRRLVPRLLDD